MCQSFIELTPGPKTRQILIPQYNKYSIAQSLKLQNSIVQHTVTLKIEMALT